MRKAVITGLGCITPLGIGVEAFWRGVRRGVSPIRLLDRFDASASRTRVAAQVDDFEPARFMTRKQAQRLDRCSQLALAAARLALEDADLAPESVDRESTAVFVGSALGGFGFAEAQAKVFRSRGERGLSPMLALSAFAGAASCNVARELGLKGPNEANAMACAAGAVSLGRALLAIRHGEAHVALAGGADAPLAPLCFSSFAVLRAMSTRNDDPSRACRPFDRERDGFVMGEGAAILVVEEEAHARARGARIYAELAGYGASNDAHHMTAPDPTGAQAARAMRRAIADAQLSLDAIGYVNAHASSTPLNDATEARVISSVFGGLEVPVSGTKALYGHSLGASGAVEALLTCLALAEGFLPGTVNLSAPDPDNPLALVPPGGREAAISAALSNSFGFGGINACLAFRRA